MNRGLDTDGVASANEWTELKSLWFALEGASDEEKTRVLADPTISPRVREQLARMVAAAPSLGARFDAPAGVSLGLHPATSVESSATLVGQRLGPYRVVRLVGRGGMGAVYEAERDDAQYRQRVAIKTIWRGADSDVLLQRFRSERQILAALQHPNIATLIDGGATESGTPWLAMEYVEGVPLDEHCDKHALSISARLDLFRQVCHAVHHAHQRLVVHRDLKPSNVLVTPDGTVKLLDFGVAKLLDDSNANATLTGDGLSPFTAAYAAPEQVNGELASTATDVYALGALLSTLLAGAPPLDLRDLNALQRLQAVREGTPRLPSAIARVADIDVARSRQYDSSHKLASALSGELDAIVQQALRHDPARRYSSAQAFSDDVHRFLRRDRVHARQDSLGYRAWSFARRNRAILIGVTAAAIALVVFSAVSLKQARNLREEAMRSERASEFMASIMRGPAGGAHDALRVGIGGTVGEFMDSAVTRVPREFPTDARLRARLYTAFGASYAVQMRYAAARVVLDSARHLSAIAYGTASEQYASASLELGSLTLAFLGPDSTEEALRAARIGTRNSAFTSALNDRVLLLQSELEFSRGHIRVADSIAQVVLVNERKERGPTSVVAAAEFVRMNASSWLRRDPREYLRRARALAALTDTVGMPFSAERTEADGAAIDAMLVLGRTDSAEARMENIVGRLKQAIGLPAQTLALTERQRAQLAGMRGDTAARRTFSTSAWALIDGAQRVTPSIRLLVGNVYVDDALERGDVKSAVRVALATRDSIVDRHMPMHLSFAQLNVGRSLLAAGDAAGAEAALRAGLAAIAAAPDLVSMGPRLRRPLAEALARQGKIAAADSVRRVDPPVSTAAPCTPGGRWVGCPGG